MKRVSEYCSLLWSVGHPPPLLPMQLSLKSLCHPRVLEAGESGTRERAHVLEIPSEKRCWFWSWMFHFPTKWNCLCRKRSAGVTIHIPLPHQSIIQIQKHKDYFIPALLTITLLNEQNMYCIVLLSAVFKDTGLPSQRKYWAWLDNSGEKGWALLKAKAPVTSNCAHDTSLWLLLMYKDWSIQFWREGRKKKKGGETTD